MKKINKFLALTLGAATAVSMAGGLQADAALNFVSDINIDGYEQIEDYYLLDPIRIPPSAEDVYLIYWKKDDHSRIAALSSPKYNDLSISIVNSEENIAKWQEIYSKYKDELDYEFCTENVTNYTSGESYLIIHMYDIHNADGKKTFDSSAFPDKTEIVKKMTAELYDAGFVKRIYFNQTDISYQDGWLEEINGFSVDYSYATEEELYDIVSKVDENIRVSSFTNDKLVVTLKVENISTPDALLAAAGAIKEAYPIAEITPDFMAFFDESVQSLYRSVNLLDPYICDIDGDGKADVIDATQILSSYADNAAGILKAAESDAMDVNADGTVDIQDATYVLAYYAEAAAGLR